MLDVVNKKGSTSGVLHSYTLHPVDFVLSVICQDSRVIEQRDRFCTVLEHVNLNRW